MSSFDVEALIRAVLIGIGTGLIVGAVGFFVMRTNRERQARWRPVLIMAACGIAILTSVGVFYAMPTRTAVPALDNLSQIEAEDLLAKKGFSPSPRPQYASGVQAGRVIPRSQAPAAGLAVAGGTVVTFGVSQQSTDNPGNPHTADLHLFEPRDHGKLMCSQGVGNITRCQVAGVASGAAGLKLLLWVQPVQPPSDVPGWYLQRPPANGIRGAENDGSWTGIVQIGDAQYPAQAGYTLNVAVSALEENQANRLLSEPGIVVRDQPTGSIMRVASNVAVAFR